MKPVSVDVENKEKRLKNSVVGPVAWRVPCARAMFLRECVVYVSVCCRSETLSGWADSAEASDEGDEGSGFFHSVRKKMGRGGSSLSSAFPAGNGCTPPLAQEQLSYSPSGESLLDIGERKVRKGISRVDWAIKLPPPPFWRNVSKRNIIRRKKRNRKNEDKVR